MSLWDLAAVIARRVALAIPDASIPVASADEGDRAPFAGPLKQIPRTRTEVYEVYGDPAVRYVAGKPIASVAWERRSCVVARNLPGYARPVYVHRLVEPYLREAMRRALRAAPGYEIKRLGCFNPRHIGRDRRRPLSYHTWAIAVDINAKRNGLVTRRPGARPGEPGHVPQPFTPGWERVSDMPFAFVDAWESVGWSWGGRWPTRVDPMHFELVR